MLLAALCLAALAPGIATSWYIHRRHGWPLALMAGVSVTVSLPLLLISSLIAFPPLGFAAGAAAGLAAMKAYDDGKIWYGTVWAATAAVAFACAGWSL